MKTRPVHSKPTLNVGAVESGTSEGDRRPEKRTDAEEVAGRTDPPRFRWRLAAPVFFWGEGSTSARESRAKPQASARRAASSASLLRMRATRTSSSHDVPEAFPNSRHMPPSR